MKPNGSERKDAVEELVNKTDIDKKICFDIDESRVR